MIDATFTVTEAEYCEAMRMFLPLRPGMSIKLRLAIVAVLCLSFGYLLADHTLSPHFVVPLFLVAAFPFAIDALLPSIRLRRSRRAYQSLHNALANVRVRLDDSGYEANGPMLKPGEFSWSDFTGWQEGETVFLLRRGKSMNLLPKSCLSQAEQAELRALLQSHVGSSARRQRTPHAEL